MVVISILTSDQSWANSSLGQTNKVCQTNFLVWPRPQFVQLWYWHLIHAGFGLNDHRDDALLFIKGSPVNLSILPRIPRKSIFVIINEIPLKPRVKRTFSGILEPFLQKFSEKNLLVFDKNNLTLASQYRCRHFLTNRQFNFQVQDLTTVSTYTWADNLSPKWIMMKKNT